MRFSRYSVAAVSLLQLSLALPIRRHALNRRDTVTVTNVYTDTTTACPTSSASPADPVQVASIVVSATPVADAVVTTISQEPSDDDTPSTTISPATTSEYFDPDSTDQPSDGLVHIINVEDRPGAQFGASQYTESVATTLSSATSSEATESPAESTSVDSPASSSSSASDSPSSSSSSSESSSPSSSESSSSSSSSTADSLSASSSASPSTSSSDLSSSSSSSSSDFSTSSSSSSSSSATQSSLSLIQFSDVEATSTSSSESSSSSSSSSTSASPTPVTSSSSSSSSSTASSSTSASSSSATSSTSGLLNGHPSTIVYSPYNSDNSCKSYDTVLSDLTLIQSKGISNIRVYGNDCNYLTTVLPISANLGLKVNQGFWISSAGVDSIDDAVDDFIAAATADDSGWDWNLFTFITIGNEAIISNFCTVDELISKISSVKSRLVSAGYTGRVTTSEPPVSWENNPSLCDSEVDFIGINPHAYFDVYASAATAGSFVQGQIEIVQGVCTGKSIFVTETGYPHSGIVNGLNVPSRENQQIAIQNIFDVVGTDVTILTTYDDYWKQPGPYGIEQSFGIIDLLA